MHESTSDSTETAAPLPRLGDFGADSPSADPARPSVVRDARGLALVVACYSSVRALMQAWYMVKLLLQNHPPITGAAPRVGMFLLLAGVNFWLAAALKRRAPAAWRAQICLSLLALSSVVFVTKAPGVIVLIAVHAFILAKWFRADTRAWFGQRVRLTQER